MKGNKTCMDCGVEFQCNNISLIYSSELCSIFNKNECRCLKCFTEYYSKIKDNEYIECIKRCWDTTIHQHELDVAILATEL